MVDAFTARPQRVCILGSTGSIGVNTLDVIARHPGRFEVWAITGASRVPELLDQCLRWRPRFAVMPDVALAAQLRQQVREAGLPTEVLDGTQALCDVASHADVDVVCLLYTSPSPRDVEESRMPSSA